MVVLVMFQWEQKIFPQNFRLLANSTFKFAKPSQSRTTLRFEVTANDAEGLEDFSETLKLTVNQRPDITVEILSDSDTSDTDSVVTVEDSDPDTIDELSDKIPLEEERILQDKTRPECPKCLCSPCIISEENRQAWWPQVKSEPCPENSNYRKNLYKTFWTMLYARMLCCNDRYLLRKNQALQQQKTGTKFLFSRRDLMPDCVIDLVRFWFPNPNDIPYMNHKWEWE